MCQPGAEPLVQPDGRQKRVGGTGVEGLLWGVVVAGVVAAFCGGVWGRRRSVARRHEVANDFVIVTAGGVVVAAGVVRAALGRRGCRHAGWACATTRPRRGYRQRGTSVSTAASGTATLDAAIADRPQQKADRVEVRL